MLVHWKAVVKCDAEHLDVIGQKNDQACDIDWDNVHESIKTLPSTKENRLTFVGIEG